jgi:hypothetical protein
MVRKAVKMSPREDGVATIRASEPSSDPTISSQKVWGTVKGACKVTEAASGIMDGEI